MGVIILKKQLENDLKKIYTDVPMPNPINIQETIIQVRREVNQAQNKGLTFWEFYFQQFGLKLYYYTISAQVIGLISSIAPLIFLSGITELSRTYTHGTIEIEMSTQYTLSQVMMSRVSILGLMDILSITILCIIVGVNTTLHPYATFLYICVPFMVTCFGCLWLLNKFKNKECNYYCFALGIFIMVIVSMSTTFLPRLYVVSSLWIWTVMLAIAIVGSCVQIYRLLNSCNKKYDYINLTHI